MKKTKILSLFTAAALMLTSTQLVFAEATAVENYAADFANAEVNSNKTGFSKNPGSVNYSSIANDNRVAVYGNAKLYKLNNVFGLNENEYGMEMVAREQRAEQPYMAFAPYAEINTDSDFYMQKMLYIGDSRENDLLRVGGEYTDASSRKFHYLWFGGNGRVYADGQGANRGRFGAVYAPNNWYNVTLAYDAEAKSMSLYIDGTLLNKIFQGSVIAPSTVSTGIANMYISARMETIDSDLGGIPSWLVMKDMKVVAGTYVPENTNTDVSSSVYTVAATSFDTVNYYGTAESYVSNVDGNVTVADFLANITAPEGAVKSVVTVDSYSKKTIAADDTDIVTDDMSLLISTVDGSLKLYDIQLNVSEEDMPVLSLVETADTNKYSVADNTITVMPHTSVAVLKSILTAGEGTTYTVENAKGIVLEDTAYLNDSSVVKAVKGNVSVKYSIVFKNTTVKDISALAALTDGLSLYEGTVSSDGVLTRTSIYGGPNLLYPIGTTHGNQAYAFYPSGTGSYKITKDAMPTSGVAAWKMETPAADGTSYNGWILHESEQTYGAASNSANGAYTITNFKIYLADANSKAYFQPMHYIPATGKGYEISNSGWRNGYGDKLVFADGQVFLGGKNSGTSFERATNYTITYNNATEYDVTLVQNTAADAGGAIYSDIYIDGVKQTVYHNNALTNAAIDGYRSIKIATAGNVYIGDLKVYMADAYSPVVEEDLPLANLEILPNNELVEINVADPLYNELPTVKTYFTTVGELKNGIDSKVNTRVEILDPTGTVVLNDNETVAGDMLVAVKDVNNSSNFIYYTISDIMNLGEFRWEETDESLVASRLVKAYKNEGKKLVFAVAAYDTTGKLIEVKLVEDTIDAIGDYELSGTVATGAASYKAMLWNSNMLPYSDSEIYIIEE